MSSLFALLVSLVASFAPRVICYLSYFRGRWGMIHCSPRAIFQPFLFRGGRGMVS
jgi:hypothetical protein